MKNLGPTLKILREFHRLKQGEFAKTIGVSPSYVCEVEKGTKNPTLEIVNLYAETFRIPASSILYLAEAQEKRSTTGRVAKKAMDILNWILISTDTTEHEEKISN